MDFFPRLKDGRHNNGLVTIGLKAYVLAGWGNGAQSSTETLEDCGDEMEWIVSKLKLKYKREKFALAQVPKAFLCLLYTSPSPRD